MNTIQNPVYGYLDTERRHIADAFIDFLFQQQNSSNADETASVIQNALRGEDIIGSYDTVDDLIEALNA